MKFFFIILGDLIRQSSPEKSISNNGRINYGFSRGSPDGDFERKAGSQHPDQFSTSSTNESDDMTIDDFGDVVKRRKSSSHSSSNKSNSHHSRSNGSNKPRTIVRQSSEEDDEDEDGWTTEF